MRKFASIPPRIWQMEMKSIRGDFEAMAVYFHLTTSGHANMLGLYYLPLPYLAHEIGCPMEGASKGLTSLIQGGICDYDHDRELVWVFEMAADQIAPQLSAKDKRVKGVADQLAMLPICPITLGFYRRYREVFHLFEEHNLSDFEAASSETGEAPSKPLRSKEKEKDLGEGKGPIGSRGEISVRAHEASTPSPSQASDTPTRSIQDQGRNAYLAAKEGAVSTKPYPVPANRDQGRLFLKHCGLPDQEIPNQLPALMRGELSAYDIEPWTNGPQ